MNIKMIVTDLDSTLLHNDKTVSEFTKSIFRKCRDKGIKITYATVRGIGAEKLISNELFDGFVRLGGAMAFSENDLVYRKYILTTQIRDFLIAVDNAGIQLGIESNSFHYANFDVSELLNVRYEITNFSALDIEAEQIYALPKTRWEVELIKNNLPENEKLHMVFIRDGFIIFMHEDAVKSKAVAALSDYWNIQCSEIVAFGDDLVDIDLLQYCGVGVAVENALNETKAVADYICDSNENDGVAKWLSKYILDI